MCFNLKMSNSKLYKTQLYSRHYTHNWSCLQLKCFSAKANIAAS